MLTFFVPFVGILGTGLAMILAAVGALAGDRVFAIITSLVGAISVFVFSPVMWAVMAAPYKSNRRETLFFVIVIAVLALPLIIIFLNSSGKIAFGKTAK